MSFHESHVAVAMVFMTYTSAIFSNTNTFTIVGSLPEVLEGLRFVLNIMESFTNMFDNTPRITFTSHLDVHRFTISYVLVVSRRSRLSVVFRLAIVSTIVVTFPNQHIPRAIDILNNLITSATIRENNHQLNNLQVITNADKTITQTHPSIMTIPTPSSPLPALPRDQIQSTSTHHSLSQHFRYPSLLLNTNSDLDQPHLAYEESIQIYLRQLQSFREVYQQAAGPMDQRE